jgi:hypothetical protein
MVLILALAAVLRLRQAGESLWIDELHTSWAVSGRWSDVLPRAAMGNQSPLYYWGLWLVVQVFGQSELTLRLPSLGAGMALPAAVYWLVAERTGMHKSTLPLGERDVGEASCLPDGARSVPTTDWAALAAALLVAIDPTCVFYAQEARPYAWVMLLAAVELILLKRLVARPTPGRRIALVVNSLVLFYLHFTAAIFLAGIVLMLPMLLHHAARERRADERAAANRAGVAYRPVHLVLDLLLAAALAAPGVIQMADIFDRRGNWAAFVESPSWAALLTAIPFVGWALLGAVIVGVGSQRILRLQPAHAQTAGSVSAEPRVGPDIVWYAALLAAIVLPLVLAFVLSRLDVARVFHIRYLVALVPLAVAAACVTTTWVSRRGVQWALLAALILWHVYSGGMLQQFSRDGRFLAARNENWRGAIAFLKDQVARDDAAMVFCEPDLIERSRDRSGTAPDEYGVFALHGLYRLPRPGLGAWGPADAFLGEVLLVGNWKSTRSLRAWYIVRGDSPSAAELARHLQLNLAAERQTTVQVAESREFGNVKVFCLEAGRTSSAPARD